jgi:intraflagellar transport protein 172
MYSPVTCLVWPHGQEHEMVFGIAEGKVKMGHEKTNKSSTLYNTDSYVISLASNVDGNAVVSGHQDGSIYRFIFGDGGRGPSYNK